MPFNLWFVYLPITINLFDMIPDLLLWRDDENYLHIIIVFFQHSVEILIFRIKFYLNSVTVS